MLAVFSFLYLKKLEFQKYMSVLENFKNIPRSPSHRATGPMCIFFSNLQRSPWRKKNKPCRPLGGRQPPVFFLGLLFLQGPILSYSSVYSSSSSARSRPLTPTARNLSFIKSRKKIARTSLISRALWNPQT